MPTRTEGAEMARKQSSYRVTLTETSVSRYVYTVKGKNRKEAVASAIEEMASNGEYYKELHCVHDGGLSEPKVKATSVLRVPKKRKRP